MSKTYEEYLESYPERPFKTHIPFGYQKKEGDPYLLVPDPALISLLDQALDQLDAGSSLRLVVEWLNSEVKKLNRTESLSTVGLSKLRALYRPGAAARLKEVRKSQLTIKGLTREERLKKLRQLRLAAEKRRITASKKRVEKLQDELQTIKENEVTKKEVSSSLLVEIDYGSEEYEEITQEVEPVFKPNPGPQTAFFAADEREVLYGGAAGGGKSYALIADPMRYFDNPNFRGIIFRRTNDELRELIWKTQELYPQCFPKSIWREKDKEWRFPSGARLWMTYLEQEKDVLRYQGQAFTYIGFDELTQYPTPHAWDYMRSRLRDASGSLPLYMRATSNPGGPGHGWVKRMFIDPAPYGEAFDARNVDTGEVLLIPYGDTDFPEHKWGKALFQRRFIPAKLADNPYLSKDGQYKSNLLSLRTDLQRQLLEGDWDVADGAAFSEFRQAIHVKEPFEIPKNWRRFRSCDFGYSERQASAVHWYAINPVTSQLIVYRELYVNKHTGIELAKKILEIEADEDISYGVLDSSVWAVRGQSGPSIAEEMIHAGCRWRPSDRSQGSRIAGKNRLHQLLRVDPFNNEPGIVFFNTCRQIISDLPVIPSDPDSDDIDPAYVSDHAYDSIRYGIMTRPRAFSPFDEWMNTPKPQRSGNTIADPTFGY